MSTIKVEGVSAAIEKLKTLERKVSKRIIRKAVRAGGAKALKAVKANTPKVNRGLQKSMVQKIKTYSAASTVVSVIGQDMAKVKGRGTNKRKRFKGGGISGRGDTVPSHLVENPTRAHRVSGMVSFVRGSDNVVSRGVDHPGTRGQHFIRRAEQSSRATIQSAVSTKLIIEIARAVDQVKALRS